MYKKKKRRGKGFEVYACFPRRLKQKKYEQQEAVKFKSVKPGILIKGIGR